MNLREVVVDIMSEIRDSLRVELERQGHVLTGRLSESIEFDISADGFSIVGRMYFEDYGIFVETGVTADRIPYGGRSGRGGKSKYIQGLITFWEGRGLSGREAIGAAFATANVHAREGMPSRSSYAFSQTGERTGFVRTVLERQSDDITDRIAEKYGDSLRLDFKSALSTLENIKITA